MRQLLAQLFQQELLIVSVRSGLISLQDLHLLIEVGRILDLDRGGRILDPPN